MPKDSVYGPYGSGQGTPGSPRSTTLERVSSGPEQPRLRMRQRLAWFGAANRPPQSAVLDPLFTVVKANHPKADLEQLIERAYRTAEHYHRGQIRKSGDPYITHPLAVATILAELGMTEPTLCAALLHDTVEDTSYTLDAAARRLRRRDRPTWSTVSPSSTRSLRRVGQGGDHPQDGDRDAPGHPGAGDQAGRPAAQHAHPQLSCVRTSSNRIAQETLEIFAPLAHRLGMNAIKWELEDLVVRHLAAEGLRRDRPAGRRGRAATRAATA